MGKKQTLLREMADRMRGGGFKHTWTPPGKDWDAYTTIERTLPIANALDEVEAAARKAERLLAFQKRFFASWQLVRAEAQVARYGHAELFMPFTDLTKDAAGVWR